MAHRRLTEQETSEMYVIVDKVFEALHGHELRCYIWVLVHTIALLWCQNKRMETVT